MIRIATEEDIPAILDIYAPYVLNTAYTFEYTVPTVPVFTQRFRTITAQCPWMVWEEEGRVLGYAYGSLPFERAAYAWCGEVSVYVAPESHGRSIGKKLYAALEEIMWRQGYHLLYALVTSENKNSLAFHEKVGYQYRTEFSDCGFKFGRWLGVIWLEKRTNRTACPAQAPVPWTAIVENDRKLSDILASLSLS